MSFVRSEDIFNINVSPLAGQASTESRNCYSAEHPYKRIQTHLLTRLVKFDDPVIEEAPSRVSAPSLDSLVEPEQLELKPF